MVAMLRLKPEVDAQVEVADLALYSGSKLKLEQEEGLKSKFTSNLLVLRNKEIQKSKSQKIFYWRKKYELSQVAVTSDHKRLATSLGLGHL